MIKLNKGFDINLKGSPAGDNVKDIQVKKFALQPSNFIGMSPIPKVEVKAGDIVKAGDVIYYDKKRPSIKYVSPVSGRFLALERGEKRSVSRLVIESDGKNEKKDLGKVDLKNRGAIVEFMLANGLWAHLNQRPFDVVPDPELIPKNIFISAFKSGPNAPDLSIVIKERKADFKKGLEVLQHLTDGKVHVGYRKNIEATFPNGVSNTKFVGPHPIGNVGIQIHHLAPINVGEMVWTVGVQDLITIGTAFNKGVYDASRIVALTGASLKNPGYVRTYLGASMNEMLKGQVNGDNNRIISGDVLSGKKSDLDGYLNFKDDQVAVIEEGNYFSLFGWMVPGKARPTMSKSYLGYLNKSKEYIPDTNLNGEFRAFVMTGQYEKVLPMDIFVTHLMKAILVKDYEKMEGLGLLELSEEDVALCEYVCTSKQPLQSILREGLELFRLD